MKIYVAAVEALRKKERQDETQFTTKITQETMLMYFFCRFFLNFTLCMTNSGYWWCLFLTSRISLFCNVVLVSCSAAFFRFFLDGNRWDHLLVPLLIVRVPLCDVNQQLQTNTIVMGIGDPCLHSGTGPYCPTASHTTRLLHTFRCGPFHGTK